MRAPYILPLLVAPVLFAQSRSAAPAFTYDVRAEGWLMPAGGLDMPEVLRRFSTDRETLAGYYTSRLSPERANALDRFAQTWLQVLDQIPPNLALTLR